MSSKQQWPLYLLLKWPNRVCIVKIVRPKTEPCGTPQENETISDVQPTDAKKAPI